MACWECCTHSFVVDNCADFECFESFAGRPGKEVPGSWWIVIGDPFSPSSFGSGTRSLFDAQIERGCEQSRSFVGGSGIC